jgi:hypothetical protein
MAFPRPHRSFWKKASSWVLISEIGIAIGIAVAGLATASRYYADGRGGLAAVVTGAAASVFVLTAVRGVLQHREREKKQSPYDLAGCLETLRGVLEASVDGDSDPGIRITVFAPEDDGHSLEQLCDYACGDPTRSRRTAARKLPSTAGVIGRAYQTRRYAVAQRVSDNPEQHVADLVQAWGFSHEAARRVDPTVRAWMAVPLMTPELGIEGIVYVDAQDGGFFTDLAQRLVLGACTGIALYSRQRYN